MLVVVTGSRPDQLAKIVGRVLGKSSVPHRFVSPHGELNVGPGDVVLFMGRKGIEHLEAAGLVPKKRTVGSLRGPMISMPGGAKGLVTHDPFVAENDHSVGVEIEIDVWMAVRLHNTGSLMPKVGQYSWVKDFSETVKYVETRHAMTGKAVDVTVDLETVGLDEYAPGAFIVTIFFTCKEGQAEGVRFTGLSDQPGTGSHLWKQIQWLLSTPKVSLKGANLKFDQRWMWRHWGIEVTNFKMDTTLVGSLIDENRSNSLNTHAKVYTTMGGYDDPFNAQHDKSRMDLALAKDPVGFLTYAGGDTDACLRASNVLRAELLEDQKLANFYVKLLHPSSSCFRRMESTGVLIDRPYFEKLGSELDTEIAVIQAKAEKMMGGRMYAKHCGDLSLTRAAVIKDFMFSKVGLNLQPKMLTDGGKNGDKPKEPSTSLDHLRMFSHDPVAREFVQLVEEFNSAKKTRTTYVTGFLKHLRSDGRFHPSYMLFRGDYDGDEAGTVTGRLSARDPAVQTIPKHSKWAKKLRRGYIPPPGYVYFEVDFSQGELRVAACLANEQNMLKAYREGLDLHLMTGCKVNGLDFNEVWPKYQMAVEIDDKDFLKFIKPIRQGGKAGNFGLLYGMSAEGYQDYAWYEYGVRMTAEQSIEQRQGFFDLYPALPHWHGVCKETVRNHGYIRSPLGRIRHLPNIKSRDQYYKSQAERQAINSPVQSCLSDLAQFVMVCFEKEYGVTPDVQFAMMIHDALAGYMREDQVDVWMPRLLDLMGNLPISETFGWFPQIRFIGDGSVGPNLADLAGYKHAA